MTGTTALAKKLKDRNTQSLHLVVVEGGSVLALTDDQYKEATRGTEDEEQEDQEGNEGEGDSESKEEARPEDT